MLDLAKHYKEGPVQTKEIARRQNISLKYLEQLVIPLKAANLVKSIRGPKGGHMLAKSPKEITIGQIVKVLEGGISLSDCVENADVCENSADCLSRRVWESATKAMYDKLDSLTLANVIKKKKNKPKKPYLRAIG